MARLIDMPATAQQALDDGVMYVLCAELTLPAPQSNSGAPWRWTGAMRNITHGGKTYQADRTVRGTEWSTASKNAEGRIALTLFDPNGTWEGRITTAGVRGNAVTLLHLLPHGDPQVWWEMSVFNGNTESVETRRDPSAGRLLRVLLEDRVFQAKFVPGEYTTDGYQKKLSTLAGQDPYDNSHVKAALGLTERWHTR